MEFFNFISILQVRLIVLYDNNIKQKLGWCVVLVLRRGVPVSVSVSVGRGHCGKKKFLYNCENWYERQEHFPLAFLRTINAY